MYVVSLSNSLQMMKMGNFVKENSRIVNTRTMLGWNPVMKDFRNLSFILS